MEKQHLTAKNNIIIIILVMYLCIFYPANFKEQLTTAKVVSTQAVV